MTPMSSQVTPMLLTRLIQRTPTQLMVVTITSRTEPSSTALAAPLVLVSAVSSPMIWKPDRWSAAPPVARWPPPTR